MRGLLRATPDGLAAALVNQHHVVTRLQLNAAGFDDMAIARRVRFGVFQRVLPATYVLNGGELSDEQRRIAATLFAGDQSQITGAAALLWYGLRYVPPTTGVHMLVPHDRRRRSTGFVTVQRTLELDQFARATDRYRVCAPARAVVDMCRQITDLRLTRAVMAEAVQRGFTTLDCLEVEVRRAARSRTAVVRQALCELLDGVRSAPEAELRALLDTSTVLPEALWNPALRSADGSILPTPDGYIADAALAFEVDSREFHSDPVGWARTLDRHNTLSQYGILVLHFTPTEIRRRPKRVLAVTERTYIGRIGQGPPAGVTVAGSPSPR